MRHKFLALALALLAVAAVSAQGMDEKSRVEVDVKQRQTSEQQVGQWKKLRCGCEREHETCQLLCACNLQTASAAELTLVPCVTLCSALSVMLR